MSDPTPSASDLPQLKHRDPDADVKKLEWLNLVLSNSRYEGTSPVVKVDITSMSGEGGANAEMRRATASLEDGSSLTLVLKNIQIESHKLARSAQLGLPRECLFYQHLAPSLIESGLAKGIPCVYYSHGDMETGEKFLVMEDLTGTVQQGYFFGPTSPHNKSKDLDAYVVRGNGGLPAGAELANAAPGDDTKRITDGSEPVSRSLVITTPEYMMGKAFVQAARFHSHYWNKTEVLFADSHKWLRASDWYQGRGKAAWESAQNMCVNSWAKIKADLPESGCDSMWSAQLVSVIDASLAKISWDGYQALIKTRPFTLAHGDFHPANMLWKPPSSPGGEDGELVLIDWEMVGVGIGPQDLGQYVISHVDPVVRKASEHQLLAAYHEELVKCGVTDYSLDDCKWDYVQGGAGRWLWFVPVLKAFVPESWQQVFASQLTAFIVDHGISEENVGMPRV